MVYRNKKKLHWNVTDTPEIAHTSRLHPDVLGETPALAAPSRQARHETYPAPLKLSSSLCARFYFVLCVAGTLNLRSILLTYSVSCDL